MALRAGYIASTTMSKSLPEARQRVSVSLTNLQVGQERFVLTVYLLLKAVRLYRECMREVPRMIALYELDVSEVITVNQCPAA